MKNFIYSLLSFLLLIGVALPVAAQKKDKVLNLTVTTQTGESLEGQTVNIVQTDYQLYYSAVTLDAQGKATVKVYAGNHSLSIDRNGYNPASATFVIVDNATTPTEVSVELTEKVRTPFALDATISVDARTGKNSVSVMWNQEKPVFYDDFESYEPFSVKFGEWTGIDGDALQAAALVGDYPNRGVMQYAQIMNPLTVEPMWYYDYPVLRAYQGKQYVGFTRTSSGSANNDWLITPELTIGTDNLLSFFAKAADIYPEKFIVYITTKTDNPGEDDFEPLTQGNYETVDYKGWHEFYYDLSQYAGQKVKLAIRYISEANSGGAFMLMVDDFYVGQRITNLAAPKKPAAESIRVATPVMKSLANPNEKFYVYLDGKELGSTYQYNWDFENLTPGNHVFGVKAKYIKAETDIVTIPLNLQMDDYVQVIFNVKADSKASVENEVLNLVSTESGESYKSWVENGKVEFKALPKGKYVANIEKGAFQTYNNELSLYNNTVVDVELQDDVLTPYNITSTMKSNNDGTMSVALKWNQVLGFNDSFEDYPDFATGEFGGWKSIDCDKMPVYPIALGKESNIVAFPGSGGKENPTAIPPIVFNPWQTTPAMLPTDVAMTPPTGDKYIMFFSPQRGQSDKWLISPQVEIYPGYSFKVTAKSYTDMYAETLEFAVCEGDSDNPDDFTVISTASKMPSTQWSQYSTPLDAYAGKTVRLAIHHTSYDTFFAQVDDVVVEAADGNNVVVDYGNVVKYNIYLDGTLVGESATAEFTIPSVSGGSHVVAIEAVYKNSKSEQATYTITVDGIGNVTVDAIPSTAEVYNIAGQKLNVSLRSLQKGVYVVKYGDKVKKIRI